MLRGSLVDRGANGGILGNDAVVYKEWHERKVDVTGIDNHEMSNLVMVDATARVLSNRGYIIVIMRQYAYHGVNRTIHSAAQLEHYGNLVDDKSIKAKGRQCITTSGGYVIPIDIINGLPYIKMEPNTSRELQELPKVFLTSADVWNPTVLDYTLSDKEDWYNIIKKEDDALVKGAFDDHGNFTDREPVIGTEDTPDKTNPQ